jgi:hypothetical protein
LELLDINLKTARRSLNILFQEWGNRGAHFWEIGNTNINLIVGSSTDVNATDEGAGTYTFYRNSVDSAAAAAASPQATTAACSKCLWYYRYFKC